MFAALYRHNFKDIIGPYCIKGFRWLTLSARMLTSSDSQWPEGQKGLRMSRAFTIFTRLVMTWSKRGEHDGWAACFQTTQI